MAGRRRPVVDHVECHVPLLVGDPGHRDDLGGMHDGGVQAGLDAFVEKHRIEHHACRGVQTEGDIGQAQRRLDIGEEPLHFANGLDRLDAVPAGFLLSGGNREGQAVENDVALAQSEVLRDVGDRPLRDAYLPIRRPRLAFLVNGEHDHRSAVLRDQAHHPAESRVGAVAVF